MIKSVDKVIAALTPEQRQALTGVKGWLRMLCIMLIFPSLYDLLSEFWAPSRWMSLNVLDMFSIVCGCRLAMRDHKGVILTKIYFFGCIIMMCIALVLYLYSAALYKTPLINSTDGFLFCWLLVVFFLSWIPLFYLHRSFRVRLTYPAAFKHKPYVKVTT